MQQIKTSLEILDSLLSRGDWIEFEDFYFALDSEKISKRQAQRIFSERFSPLVSDLDYVVDGLARPLKQKVLPQLKAWISARRLKVKILQVNESSRVLALVDFRGHAALRQLDQLSGSAVNEALAELPQNIMIFPHGLAHQLTEGFSQSDGPQLLTAAHLPLPFDGSLIAVATPKTEHQHLRELEEQGIHIIREAVAVAEKPAMLFSLGKDSMAMLRLAQKAFAPEPIPFPLVNIDTRWKFQEMNTFREWIKSEPNFEVTHYTNPEALARDINPFDQGSAVHTEITKTHALKQILDKGGYDFVFGGARRDEEKSRAKERVFSVRSKDHAWDPKNQRPELWNFYNTFLGNDQSMRVFPLSNWTELDVWRYLERENVPLVPLYFSGLRPVVERNGSLIMVDDDRFRLEPGEKIRFEKVRFRSLGCYPLSGAMRSEATSIVEIIEELEKTKVSERSSRVIDFDRGASMEQKKKEGYF